MTVFVSGGTRGIGRAIALRFARDGAKRVAVGYLRNDRAGEDLGPAEIEPDDTIGGHAARVT